LDGEDKDYGYIIDYMDLFNSLESAFNDYTSGVLDAYDKEDVAGLLKDRLKAGKERLDEALEAIRALCEPVEPPKDDNAYVHYFCGSNTRKPEQLKDTEPRRVSLYKLTIALIRAYANIADDMKEAGYSDEETEKIRKEIKYFEEIRGTILIASGDYEDLKKFEPAMRHLIDSYIGAEDSRVLAKFDDLSLVDALVERGKDGLECLPANIRKNKETMAEVIENNLRRVIIEESPANPMYYEKMSQLLDELIKRRMEETMEYEKYLQEFINLTRKVKKPNVTVEYPASLNTGAKRALYDNLGKNEALAIELDITIQRFQGPEELERSRRSRSAG
jgi:type I restriction enzyme R subunit